MDSFSRPNTEATGLPDEFSWFAQEAEPLERAILLTLTYSDLFDYPLSLEELHRYLIGLQASPDCIDSYLSSSDGLHGRVTTVGGYITFSHRVETVVIRRQRAAFAKKIWPDAVEYGRTLSGLPFVRMVAVTGALAVDNVDREADIDYLILTEPGRLWLARAWCILLVRIARRRGVTICPNFFLTTRALENLDRSLYSAHEVTQMVPLEGWAYYQRLREVNSWVYGFLPNASGPPRDIRINGSRQPRIQQASELPQRAWLGSVIENWEMNRKIRKFSTFPDAESLFSSDQCKGHFDLHGARTSLALQARLKEIDSLR